MYKIAILGCENGHANAFLKFVKEGKYPDIEIIGIYSDEPEAVKKLNTEFGVPIMENYDDAVGIADGIMITARHGDNHFKYAKPYLASGIPMFIDKPITCTEEEAVEFMRLAKANNVRLCGGSSCALIAETLELADAVKNKTYGDLRGGCVIAPVQMDSRYGGFFFYSEHLVDIMLKIFGEGVRNISAEKQENTITLTMRYDDFTVIGMYVNKTGYYRAVVCGTTTADARKIIFTDDAMINEMDEMLHLLRGGEMGKSYESFIYPVFIMNTILRAIDSGKPEQPNEIKI